MFYRLRDFPKARTWQYPSSPHLGIHGLRLKLRREHFELVGERLGSLDERWVGRRRSRGDCGLGALVDQLVGKKERCEKKLARFRQRSQPSEGFPAFSVNEARCGSKIVLFPIAARDLVAAPSDVEIDEGGHQAAA